MEQTRRSEAATRPRQGTGKPASNAALRRPTGGADLRIAGVIGAELAGPVHTMHRIVQEFHDTNHVSRVQMAELCAAIDEADAIARHSQQLARLAEGRLRQSHERVALDQLVESALQERQSRFRARGVEVQRNIRPVEIVVDPGLLSALVDAAMDWGLQNSQRLVVTLGITNWPEHGLLLVTAGQSVTDSASQRPVEAVDTLKWQLLSQIAQAMGVTLSRSTSGGETTLSLEFARTVKQLEGLTTMEIEAGSDGSAFQTGTKALAGLRLLLVSADSAVRAEVENACQLLGLRADTVPNSAQAVRYTERDRPHMIVVDERARGPAFDELIQDVRRLDPNFGFLEITNDADTFEMSSWQSDSTTRVSRNVLRAHLPAILTLELAKAF